MYAYANLFGHYPVRVIEVNGYGSDGYADVSLLGNIRASVPIDRITIQERDMSADLAAEVEQMTYAPTRGYAEIPEPEAYVYEDKTYRTRTGRKYTDDADRTFGRRL